MGETQSKLDSWTPVYTPQPRVAQLTIAGQRRAICELAPSNASGVYGVVRFAQTGPNSPTQITAEIYGLTLGKHGFHIHQYGDLSKGCETAGPHFNPFEQDHGGPGSPVRHVGDLGNISMLKGDKAALFRMEDDQITLFGPHHVLGRSVVVHADPDDLGRGNFPDSKTTGHSGARLACGIIGLSYES